MIALPPSEALASVILKLLVWTCVHLSNNCLIYVVGKLCRELQTLQRDRLVACMLEHIDEEYVGKVRVRHNTSVEGLSVGQDGVVNLKWLQSGDAKGANGTSGVRRGMARAPFVVCWSARFRCVCLASSKLLQCDAKPHQSVGTGVIRLWQNARRELKRAYSLMLQLHTL